MKPRLANGLRVVVAPHAEPRNRLAWACGSASAPATRRCAQQGISHLLEHMAFKGTKRRKAKRHRRGDQARGGGELNAATSLETTAYFARVLGPPTLD